MTDSTRPARPQFGEYATPEEQRASIREPIDHQRAEELGVAPVVPLTDHRTHDAVPERAPERAPAPTGSAHPVNLDPAVPAAGRRPASGDRTATFVLLGIGIFNIVITLPMLVDLPGALRPAFVQLGITGYSSDALAQMLGIIALMAQVVLWIVTLWLSTKSLRAGRTTFWIPLVAGVVANIVVLGCLMIAMLADPAVAAYFQTMAGR
jgi:hypothetical protein